MIPEFPRLTTAVFIITVLLVAASFVLGLRIAGRRNGEPGTVTRAWTLYAAGGMFLWLVLTGAVAASGVLRRMDAMPPPLLLLLAVSVGLTLVLAFSRIGLRLLRGIGLPWLIGYQIFRIPVEGVLYSLFTADTVPVQMTFEGQNWDIFSGITAIGVAWWAARGNLPSAVLLGWNLLGLGLLANIVTVAVLSAPLPFRVFMNEPPNVFVTYLPYVWLPAVLVQAALFGHLLMFRQLWRQRGVAQA